MKKSYIYRLTAMSLAILLCSIMFSSVTVKAGAATIDLGTAVNFAVLAGTTVSNTGSSVISGTAGGDVGVAPGTAIIGFPPGTISGTFHSNDAVAEQAQTDLTSAYNEAAGRAYTSDLSGQDLGGMTLTSGVYYFATSAALTGTLTLDAGGDSDAAFIFQIGSTLTTASSSIINLINGAESSRVFWQVGSSATLGTSSQFKGQILAMVSITATTSGTVVGQLLARDGAVTLDTIVITNEMFPLPTATPTVAPTVTPTLAPTATPTVAPTATPTVAPTATPTLVPTVTPSPTVTPVPTVTVTPAPSATPTAAPTATPTAAPTATPTITESESPQTGETGSFGFTGLILIVLAGGLILFFRQRRMN